MKTGYRLQAVGYREKVRVKWRNGERDKWEKRGTINR
jgi:hypothetical protein